VAPADPSGSADTRSQLDLVEDYFNRHALQWHELYVKPRRVNDLVLANRRRVGVEQIREHVGAGARVLDAGCGAGLAALDLARQGFFVHAVDIAEPMLALCRERFEEAGIARDRYEIARADASRLDVEPGSLGGIVALGFLEYQDDELAALRRLHRLLEPDGTLVLSGGVKTTLATYLGIPARVRSLLARVGLASPPDDRGPIELHHQYSVRRLRGLLEAAGFDVLQWHGHGFVDFRGIGRRLPYRGQLLLHRTLTAAARFLPIAQWANDLIMVARKRPPRSP
jgi:2-polyprenyl-3-methyl-5-hydroxy-6-metoxy-1,4-benzoquinol methylase